MKIIIAMDSFKGSLSSMDVVNSVAKGIRKVLPEAELVTLPIADGGEGTVDTFLSAMGGRKYQVSVSDPIGRTTAATYCVLPDGTAVIEMAQASGLTLLKEDELDPLRTSTYGTGELISHALDQGCRRFIVGIGGSATNDGGAGMAQALGVQLFDRQGNILPPGGAALAYLDKIDCSKKDSRLSESTFMVACDVTNPLCGPQGAAAVYGPQKGANKEDIAILDDALMHYAHILNTQLGIDIALRPGAGAAGGLGAGLMAFCGAKVAPGIQTILDAVKFESLLENADLVITGEGRIDAQSFCGKVPFGVAKRTKAVKNIPVIAVVGCVGEGAESIHDAGVDAILPITDKPMTLQYSMENADMLLQATAIRLIHLLQSGSVMVF